MLGFCQVWEGVSWWGVHGSGWCGCSCTWWWMTLQNSAQCHSPSAWLLTYFCLKREWRHLSAVKQHTNNPPPTHTHNLYIDTDWYQAMHRSHVTNLVSMAARGGRKPYKSTFIHNSKFTANTSSCGLWSTLVTLDWLVMKELLCSLPLYNQDFIFSVPIVSFGMLWLHWNHTPLTPPPTPIHSIPERRSWRPSMHVYTLYPHLWVLLHFTNTWLVNHEGTAWFSASSQSGFHLQFSNS